MKKPPREVEIDEVIPPTASPTDNADPIQKVVAHILDNLFQIPGTKIRIGLDPLLGLLPGFGDTLSGLVSTAMLGFGLKQGIPRIVIARMAFNILLNAILGAVPLLGDAFSFWFKSNARNYELYRQHARGARRSTTGDWLFVAGLIACVAFFLIAGIASVVWLVSRIASGAGRF